MIPSIGDCRTNGLTEVKSLTLVSPTADATPPIEVSVGVGVSGKFLITIPRSSKLVTAMIKDR